MAELNETDHRAIHNLKSQGYSVRKIAGLYKCHRRTILKVMQTPLREGLLDGYAEQDDATARRWEGV